MTNDPIPPDAFHKITHQESAGLEGNYSAPSLIGNAVLLVPGTGAHQRLLRLNEVGAYNFFPDAFYLDLYPGQALHIEPADSNLVELFLKWKEEFEDKQEETLPQSAQK